jgi:uncharacterized protein
MKTFAFVLPAPIRLLSAVAATLLLALPAKAEPAMWVIRDKDSTIYLIGTIHLLRHDADWNSTKVMKTLKESTELWLEVANINDQASTVPLITQYGMDAEKTLSSKLNAAQNAKLSKVAARYSFPQEGFEQMNPWMAALTFEVLPLLNAGYDPDAGVDLVLKAQAEKEGDKVYGFETAEKQVRFLAEMSQAEQVAFLDATLDDADKGTEQLEKLAKAWMDGDTDTIGQLLVNDFKKEAPAAYDKLVVQRNIAWAGKIAKMLEGSGVQQIAVGAAHLAGPDSLQVQLAKRGIKAEKY